MAVAGCRLAFYLGVGSLDAIRDQLPVRGRLGMGREREERVERLEVGAGLDRRRLPVPELAELVCFPLAGIEEFVSGPSWFANHCV